MSDIDDTSSVAALSEAVTETASQPSTLNTRSAAAGSIAFATFRGGTLDEQDQDPTRRLRTDQVDTQEEEGEDVAYRPVWPAAHQSRRK
ncbi:hypothetical protein FOMA001_g13347 [Fusarium oxysporum f. sp. matthiolae]|nr:hypothetical protein FOMA001_g13347 [Fusarium oxysporum f. sp. matthiolae]